MKKWLPWLITGAAAAWVLAGLRPAADQDFAIRDFGRLPVLLNGRVQPLDSVARNSLRQMRSKQDVRLADGQRLPANRWLLEVMLRPETADTYPVFRIDHPELLSLLKLPEKEIHFSFQQLHPLLGEIDRQAERVSRLEAAAQTPLEKQVLKLYANLNLYHRLKNTLRPESSEDFFKEITRFQASVAPGVAAVRAREAGQDYNTEAFNTLVEALSRYDALASQAYALLVPPPRPDGSREDWKTMGAALMEVARGEPLPPAVAHYAAMATAYRQSNPAEFNRQVTSYRQWLGEHFPRALRKGQNESFFNAFEPFYRATTLYALAFLLGIFSWVFWSEWLRRTAAGLVAFTALLHTFGLVYRMILEGRPPVTNLYSSAIFIGWGAVLLGLVLERFYRDGIGTVTASLIGLVTLIIAHNLALGGDTMEMLRAVLDTNFWLATHVVAITLGYSANFVAGLLAIIYIVRGVLTRTLKPATGTALTGMVYGILCFALLFSFVGTVLGGIWADQSWGRFWGWDPKENGALIIVLWNAVVLHARWGGLVQQRGLMNMAVFGNIVTSFSWFGVNMLGIGLHSYGFMDEAFRWLLLFVISQGVIIALGCVPTRWWLSSQEASRKPESPPAPLKPRMSDAGA